MPWGIAETASEIEKIKAESSDMLNGWNACGVIDEDAYSQLWDFYNDLLNRAYEQGLKDAPADIVRCKDCKHEMKCMQSVQMYNQYAELDDFFMDMEMGFCSLAERKEDE